MGRIGRRSKLRSVIFFVCVVSLLLAVLKYRTSIVLALVGMLNALVETYDSLAGR